MPTSQEAVIRLYDARLTDVFYTTWDALPEQFSKVFKARDSKKRQEEDYHLGGATMWPESSEGGAVEYEEVAAGEVVTYKHVTYKRGMQANREAIDDDLYDALADATQDLAVAGRARVETEAAAILGNGFSVNGYDGVPLFSNSHPLPKGPVLDNLASGELTDANLKAALILGRKHTNNSGIRIMTNYRNLIVPPDLEYTAVDITQSQQKSGTADNDINALRGRLAVIVLDYLQDFSTTAWFIQDPENSKLKFYWRVKPEFKRMTDFDTDIHKWRGYTRFSVGYSAPQGIVGSPGV